MPAISTTTTHTLDTEDHLRIICVPPRAGVVRHNDASTYHRGGTTTLGLAREAVSLIRLVARPRRDARWSSANARPVHPRVIRPWTRARRLSRESPYHEAEFFGNYYYTDGPRADAG